jgi:hypothetical protein
MNKNKSRRNRMTYKKRSYKKINRTRKGGMPGNNKKRPFSTTTNVNNSLNSSGSRPHFSVSSYSSPERSNSSRNYSSPPPKQINPTNDNPPGGPSKYTSFSYPNYLNTSDDFTLTNEGLNVNTKIYQQGPTRISSRIASQVQPDYSNRQKKRTKEEIKDVNVFDPRNQLVSNPVMGSALDNIQQSQQPQQTLIQNIREYIIHPFLSWFDVLLQDIPNTSVFRPQQNTPPQKNQLVKLCNSPYGTDIQTCEQTPIGQKITFKGTPDTTGVIVGTSLVDFSTIIVEYLNKRIPQTKIKTSLNSTEITIYNYYINFLIYLQEVKGFRIYDNKSNKLNDYFKTSNLDPDESTNKTNFDRNKFIEFVNSILPKGLNFEPKKLRIDYTGKALAEITRRQSEISGDEEYISNFKENTNQADECDSEKEWVFRCINNRNNNYISIKVNGEWKKLIDKTSDTVKKTNLINNLKKGKLYKQECGKCWICGQEIYHYYVIEPKTGKIYLNTKCGEDEHVFPPTVGDIIGTLNMDSGLTRETIDEYGTNTLLTYGIRPSHAFCNQMKSDFLLYALLVNNDNPSVNALYIQQKWKETVDNWFKKERYNSLENIADIFKNYQSTNRNIINSGTNRTPIARDNYYRQTISVIEQYLNRNIAPMILQQAREGKSNVGNMLKLKILIYIIQIGKNIIGEPFLEIWNKNMINE